MDELEKDPRFKQDLNPPDFLDQKIMQYAREHQQKPKKILLFPQLLKFAAAVVLIMAGYLLSSIQQKNIPVVQPVSIVQPAAVEKEPAVTLDESLDLLDAELFYLEMDMQSDLATLSEI